MNIDDYLFKDEAYRGERTALRFRWVLIIVIFLFIIVTLLKGNYKEAFYASIPVMIFLIYNIYLWHLIKTKQNFYFLRYFSVTIDTVLLTVHIYLNSIFFSDIAVSTTASIFIYPILMFLAVLRYDKKLILFSTLLTIFLFNLNYYLRLKYIDNELISKVISSDVLGHTFKSGYLLILGLFFLKIPDLVYRFIKRQKEALERNIEIEIKLDNEKKEKGILEKLIQEKNELNEELVIMNEQIAASNKSLNELVQTKDKLLSFISHDLKNSFSTMASIVETTLDNFEEMSADDISKSLEILYKHSNKNHELFDNLLKWARLQSGKLTVQKERIELNLFFKDLHRHFENQLELKNLELKIEENCEFLVLADRNMLKSIFINLIGNAIKFTPKGKKINVHFQKKAENIIIKIIDEGIGIEKERIDKIFDIGQNVTMKGTEGEKGSGFGLLLCKELIEKNNGTIELQSEFGKGSSFNVILPSALKN
ncbi:MAG: HAMP domain-containing histidine kinase [Bacteroidales bacterium]|nr:HAMP domain-containing histidine kinase [Bacteroidales bacterium]MBN2757845.1 HAMP domain-containing histidine kinase [Bacteroidales bacterium]